MRFLDFCKIFVKGGDGGDGIVSFRREKFIAMGGPDGGNGGRGGNVIIEASDSVSLLVDYAYKRKYAAKNGRPGQGKQMAGAKGEDLILKVPIGTQVFDETNTTMIADLNESDKKVLIASGGKGGLGNNCFKSSINKAPRKSTKGELGEEFNIHLRLKLIADIGILGMPNAGKSTFLSKITNAKGKIANYPFSTTVPKLGTFKKYDRDIIIADIPGLIKDAHKGKGLGDRFLAHIERCKVLIYMIDIGDYNLKKVLDMLTMELGHYSKELIKKPYIIAFNKIDMIDAKDLISKQKKIAKQFSNQKYFFLSSLNGDGVNDLLNASIKMLSDMERDSKPKEQKNQWSPI